MDLRLGSSVVSSRFSRGCLSIHPKGSKYEELWDLSLLLDFLDSMDSYFDLSLADLRAKTVALIRIERIARSAEVAKE